ncbi:putative proton-dependent oligopeptide transporter family, major facilitator superfamily [Lupinus albus]|uniref:Putative proton-dependent oligopeptide transporter family, major facilitator superfamily n=1 Tax=Lupinus albus TaxID=3870 RepID=A0A6A4PKK4_LUPAL|nr:putative proton-dependent oligopeptide transporter family, major facilitator superfamily [Lupinus albus]
MYSLFNYLPHNSVNSNLPYTYQFRLLDKAAIVTPEDKLNPDGSAADPWNLWCIQQVEEVKCLLRVLPILFSCISYSLANTQEHTVLVFQVLQSDRRLGHSNFIVPAASYIIFTLLSTTIWLRIYDRIMVPFVRRFTGREGGITILQRMGIGMFLTIPMLLISAVVEEHRRTLALTKPIGILPRKGAISSMSGLMFIPQLVLSGVADAFTSVGQVELYYKSFPENMRTIAGSLFFCCLARTSYLNTFLISVVHKTTSKSATGNW